MSGVGKRVKKGSSEVYTGFRRLIQGGWGPG